MKVEQFNLKNKKLESKLDLNDAVWSVPFNADLVAQVLHVYQSNKRTGLAHAKTRAEVRGGGRKPWAQKGTGRARAGSIRSPLWKGGGVTFVPSHRNWSKRINSKMKGLASKMVLSKILADKDLKFVEINEKAELSDIRSLADGKVRILVVTDNKNVYFALRNVTKVEVVSAALVNSQDLVKAKEVVVDTTAVAKLEERLANGK